MRKLLILTAGAALLATPVAAQPYGPYGVPPYPPMPPMPPAAYYMPMPMPPPPPPPGYYPRPAYYPAPVYYSAPAYYPAPAPTQAPIQTPAPVQTQASTGRVSGTWVYVSTVKPASSSVLSNQPVRDTPATRAFYPPLSRAGWRTAPRGN